MKYRVGDILVQIKGQPWVAGAWLATGYANPHACGISKIDCYGRIWIIENGKTDLMQVAGVRERLLKPGEIGNFKVLRPLCDAATAQAAVDWARNKEGEIYGYARLLQVGLGYRLGLYRGVPGMDDNPSLDTRPMLCSELWAMAYYRSGYDLVPHVENVDTLPHDFLLSQKLVEVAN